MIRCCVEAGDFSPIEPISVRDLIYIEAFQRLRSKDHQEIRKLEVQFQADLHKSTLDFLADIRQIQLAKLPFETQQKAAIFYEDLPSQRDRKEAHSAIGMSRGARKLEEQTHSP